MSSGESKKMEGKKLRDVSDGGGRWRKAAWKLSLRTFMGSLKELRTQKVVSYLRITNKHFKTLYMYSLASSMTVKHLG